MSRRPIRRAALLLLLAPVLLAGCMTQMVYPDPVKTMQGGKAVLYTGIAGTQLIGQNNTFYATWMKIDPATGRLADGDFDKYRVYAPACSRKSAPTTDCENLPMAYFPLAVEPGTYVLHSLTAWGGNGFSRTRVTVLAPIIGIASGRRFSPATLAKAIQVTVKAGEVVFVGNFRFNTRTHPATLKSYDRDMTRLKTAVRVRPPLAKALVYRDPTPAGRR